MTQLEFERVAPSHPLATDIIRELDGELAQRYPVESIHGLYEGAGYRSIPAYGEYIGNTYSLCYEKLLDP